MIDTSNVIAISRDSTIDRLVDIAKNVPQGAEAITASNIKFESCKQYEEALASNPSTQAILSTLSSNATFVTNVQADVAKKTLCLHLFFTTVTQQKDDMQLSHTQRDIAKYYTAKLIEDQFQEST